MMDGLLLDILNKVTVEIPILLPALSSLKQSQAASNSLNSTKHYTLHCLSRNRSSSISRLTGTSPSHSSHSNPAQHKSIPLKSLEPSAVQVHPTQVTRTQLSTSPSHSSHSNQAQYKPIPLKLLEPSAVQVHPNQVT
ncbi:hypothetical protein HNR77_006050 [Paenibacillus sp. JGP012]|nr:hypothetical protein [Paenibacillus sp. JGP012]